MAALNRPVTATYEVQESVRIDTLDHEDHTFCGIMFPVRTKTILPIERLVIQSVAVRGQLGPMTVWVTKPGLDQTNPNGDYSFRILKRDWIKIYERKHRPSRRVYATLELEEPVVLEPGQVRMMYIHSTDPSDEAIVYDQSNMHPRARTTASLTRYEDDKIAIHSGKAHLSPRAFGQTPIWGWGNAWRDRREFVGQIRYGTVYKLWSPERHLAFGSNFDAATVALLKAQRHDESPMATLPDECIYYILNMCRWDWFEDDSHDVRRRRRILMRRVEERAALETVPAADDPMDVVDPAAVADAERAVDGDDSDDDDFAPDEEDEEEEDDDDDDGDDDDDDDHVYHRADTSRFVFHHTESDDDDSMGDDDEEDDTTNAPQWNSLFGQVIPRQMVLRALGSSSGH